MFALTGDREVAEDIAQESLWRAYRRWETIGAYDRPGAWVRRVALNLVSSQGRRWRVERRALARLAARREAPAMELDDDVARFWSLVRTLPAQQAAAVALHYLEDQRIADVAYALGCAEGTAKVHLHRGRLALARQLGMEGNEQQA